jgi:hypothetical protein
VHTLFSKRQRGFYAEHAPEGIDLDDLAILGPINVLKLKYSPEGFSQRLALEQETKTKTALAYFSKALKQTGGGP